MYLLVQRNKQHRRKDVKPCVRIIGGLYRGKKIFFPELDGLRPTPDRIKETLFNWLMYDIRGARCLDAFAGSGALGFEALSRGAASVNMCELSPVACKALKQTALTFNNPELTIINADARSYLKNTKGTWDIIFLDPPFRDNCLEEILSIITTANCLNNKGLLYIESPTEILLDANLWHQRKFKKAGQVFYALFEKC
jgi:16S rRNA (guanine966-N2)-methyltransferase